MDSNKYEKTPRYHSYNSQATVRDLYDAYVAKDEKKFDEMFRDFCWRVIGKTIP